LARFENNFWFKQVNFKSDIDLSYTEFLNGVDFSSSAFLGSVKLDNTKFYKDSIFVGATFSNLVNFKYTTFKENVSFRDTKFDQGLNLARVNINNSAILDFHDATINSNKAEKQVSSKDKQETCRILKHESLKKNDTINAINLHKKECEHHYQSLNWCSKDFFNKLILGFEKMVSSYGTNALKSLLVFIVFNILTFVTYIAVDTNFAINLSFSTWNGLGHMLEDVFKTLVPTIISGEKSVYKESWVQVIHFVINASLIYEIIKSFRKYSRKL